MFKKTVTYTDYNGLERTEDFYFNLTKAEVFELQLGTKGTLSELLENIIKTQDAPQMIEYFKKIVLKAYGEKSPDGRRFIKTDEVRESFEQTEAYSIIFMELAKDDKAAAAFVNGIMPQNLDKHDIKRLNDKMNNAVRDAETATKPQK